MKKTLSHSLSHSLILLQLLLSGSLLSQEKGKQIDAAKIRQLRNLHEKVLLSVVQGQDIDTPVSKDIRKLYPDETHREVLHHSAHGGGTAQITLSSRQVLERIDAELQSENIQVKIEVLARPDSCSVKYRPYLGGMSFDAGLTRTVVVVDPMAYVFSCECGKKTSDHVVDGTSDQRISFDCRR